jgi:Bacteriophage baseplate protein W
MSDIYGSGLGFPLGVDHRGGVGLVQGDEDIQQAIGLILRTAPGERVMRPEFGCAIHDVVFDTIDAAMIGTVEVAVRQALERWEPRVDVVGVDFELSSRSAGVLDVMISYRIRATNRRNNLVFPFYVIPAEEAE